MGATHRAWPGGLGVGQKSLISSKHGPFAAQLFPIRVIQGEKTNANSTFGQIRLRVPERLTMPLGDNNLTQMAGAVYSCVARVVANFD